MTRRALVAVVLGLWWSACPAKPAASVADAGPARVVPRPLEPLERVVAEGDAGSAGDEEDPLYRVVPLPPVGPPVPRGLPVVRLDGERVLLDGAPLDLAHLPAAALVEPGEAWFAQLFELLAAADDQGRQLWLKHPDAAIAFRLKLRDEPAFQVWLDEAVPGKLRIIQRADGFELQTNMGKLPGPDPKGPTVPVRGGHLDLKTFQRGLERIQSRFRASPDYCWLPSFGMEVAQVARAMAANYVSAELAYFPETCLVYHRLVPDAGRQ